MFLLKRDGDFLSQTALMEDEAKAKSCRMSITVQDFYHFLSQCLTVGKYAFSSLVAAV